MSSIDTYVYRSCIACIVYTCIVCIVCTCIVYTYVYRYIYRYIYVCTYSMWLDTYTYRYIYVCTYIRIDWWLTVISMFVKNRMPPHIHKCMNSLVAYFVHIFGHLGGDRSNVTSTDRNGVRTRRVNAANLLKPRGQSAVAGNQVYEFTWDSRLPLP